MFDFLPQVLVIVYESREFWPRKLCFRTVCKRLVRGIKEGWSVIDIVRDSHTDSFFGPGLSGFSVLESLIKVLLCCLGWDDEENCGNFIFTRKGEFWSRYQLKTIQVLLSGIKIYRILKEEKTRIRVQNRLELNKRPTVANLMMTDIVKLKKMVRVVPLMSVTFLKWFNYYVSDLNAGAHVKITELTYLSPASKWLAGMSPKPSSKSV